MYYAVQQVRGRESSPLHPSKSTVPVTLFKLKCHHKQRYLFTLDLLIGTLIRINKKITQNHLSAGSCIYNREKQAAASCNQGQNVKTPKMRLLNHMPTQLM